MTIGVLIKRAKELEAEGERVGLVAGSRSAADSVVLAIDRAGETELAARLSRQIHKAKHLEAGKVHLATLREADAPEMMRDAAGGDGEGFHAF